MRLPQIIGQLGKLKRDIEKLIHDLAPLDSNKPKKIKIVKVLKVTLK